MYVHYMVRVFCLHFSFSVQRHKHYSNFIRFKKSDRIPVILFPGVFIFNLVNKRRKIC